MLAIRLKTFALPHIGIVPGLVYLFIALRILLGYLHWDANLITGLALAPFICTADRNCFSSRYLVPALLTLVLAVFIPVNTMLFIALLFAVLFWIENNIGKLSDSFLFLLFLVSPVFKYITGMFDFPVRLWLTGQTAAFLSFGGIKAVAAGNQVQLANCDFSIDPACTGLNMLIISLVLSLFVLMHFQRQTGRRLPFIYLAGFFLATIGLNIVSNFFRILVLVGFKIMPGTFFHDFVGIVCLLIYVIIPLALGVKPMLNRFGKTTHAPSPTNVKQRLNFTRHPALHAVLAAVLLFIMLNVRDADTLAHKGKSVDLPGFSKYEMSSGITRFYNKDALIYLKPTVFFAPEHDPMICWTGSGYEFTTIQKEKISGIEIYTGTLEKGHDKIFAAWWFDNGDIKTVNQLQWRWAAAKGQHPFSLVNVNAASKESLSKQVEWVLERGVIAKRNNQQVMLK